MNVLFDTYEAHASAREDLRLRLVPACVFRRPADFGNRIIMQEPD